MRKIEAVEKKNSAEFAAMCEEVLRRGHQVRFRAIGESMRPNISSGDTVLIAPATAAEIERGDVVLTHDDQRLTLHRAVAFETCGAKIITRGDSGQQSDSATDKVLGKLVAIRDEEKEVPVTRATPYRHALRSFLHRLKLAAARRFASNVSGLLVFGALAGFGSLLGAAPATAQFTITNAAAPALPTTVAPGANITFTVVLSNNTGAVINHPITVTMPLPGSTTFVSGTKTAGTHNWTCALSGPNIVCTDTSAATYPNASTTTFSIIVSVNAGTANGTVITGTATGQGIQPVGTTINTNNASASSTVGVLSITDVAAPATTAAPGQNITYTQVLTNTSTTAVTHPLTLTQNLPANTTFVSAARTSGTDAWTCTNTVGVITCTDTSGGTYAVGGTTTFSVVVTVNAAVTNGTTINDTVSAQGGNSGAAVTATSNVTAQAADISMTQSALPNPVGPAGTITYTETVTNNSAVVGAYGVSLTQNTPANTTFASITTPAGWTCGTVPAVGGTGAITCTANAALAVSSTSGNFSIVLNVSAAAANGSTITNSATVSETGTDPTLANNTTSTSVTVQIPDISMTQTAAPTTVAPRGSITYTETVTNNSASVPSLGASLTQNTPTNTTFVSATPPAGWTCGTVPAVGGTGAITCTASAALAPSSTTGNFSIVVAVNAGVANGTNITNSATVTETATDPTPGNNTTTTMVPVGFTDMGITQTAPAAVAAGSTISFVQTVVNNGPAAAPNAIMYQQTPVNTTFSSITPPAGWTCGTQPAVGGTGQVICTANSDFVLSTPVNFTFVVTVNAGTTSGTTIVNYADATSSAPDSNGANNAITTSVLVETTGQSDISVSMTAAPTPVFIASLLTYNITVKNLGLAAASAVVLTDIIPGGTTFSSVSSVGGSCVGTATVTCTFASLAVGASGTVTLVVTTPNTASTLTNTASTSYTGDPVATNNSAIAITVVQPLVCATPGKDGLGGTLSTIVNAYYSPATVGTVLTAGTTTSVTLGVAAAGGAQTPIAKGDLLLIMQMQDAAIISTNSGVYGDNSPGDPATGSSNLNSSGQFEFVTATSAVPISGGSLTFTGTGASSLLLNTYTSAAATATQGQRVFQVIRVPQYTSATLSSGLAPLAWNGTVGGVVALDVASQLTLGGTVTLDATGFRGGAGRNLAGGAGNATDYVVSSANTTGGSKGEGIAGTPRYMANSDFTVVTDTTLEGLPGGSYLRGAPGNAGGGATDGHPSANDQNTGGGAGGNGGTGGQGGYGWTTAGTITAFGGGFGGSPFPASTGALTMGGGGGAGTTNNGTADPANTNPAGINSSGAAGGGIVIIHAGSVTGTGTITSNGQTGLNVLNDGGGGGGAGGSIRVLVNSGGLGGLTVHADGGKGGNTWASSDSGTTFTGVRHGPGGGGGGGVLELSATPAAFTVAAGLNGTTTTANDAYGATVGTAGQVYTALSIPQTPGTQPGAECAGADLAVTNVGTPNPVTPTSTITYTQVVTNSGPNDALNVVFSEAIPANTTFSSIAAPGGWTCNSNASILSTGLISCTNPDVPSGVTGTGTFTVKVTVNSGTTFGTQIVDVASISAGTNDPNLTNNSATATNVVGSATSMYLTLTKVAASNTVAAGNNITYTMVVTNNGPGVSNAGVYDTVPVSTTFVSMTASAGWGCSVPAFGAVAGTNLSCTTASFANGASATITLVVNVIGGTANGTTITNTANANGGLPNPNPNAATAISYVLVAAATQADLSVTSSASPNPVLVGGTITYAQIVTNNGPATASTLTFTDVIPTGTTFVSIPTLPAGWSCSTPAVGATGSVTCTIASLVTGGTASFPLIVKLAPATMAGTTISNSPGIASATSDPNSANNTATSTTLVASPTQADVTITKTAAPEPVDVGANLTYTIQVTNNGPAVATGVSVSDPLPTQVTFASASATQGSCTTPAVGSTGGTVTCTIGTLSVGGTALITINVNAAVFSSSSVNCPPVTGPQFNACNAATLTTTSSNPGGPAATIGNPVIAYAGSTIQASTAVQLASFQALVRSQGGVVLEWHTREEIRNLGFNIYREDAQGRKKINPSLIAGGALLVRGGRPQHGAKTYQWLDAAGSPNATYWLEDVDLNGTRAMHGPAHVEAADASAPAARSSVTHTANAMLLTQLNSSVTSYGPKSGIRPLLPRPILPVPGPHEYRASLENMPAVKIAVSNEGWYRVSSAQLIAAGLDPNADVRNLQLYAEGLEQPLSLRGQQTGHVRSLDSIEFYGTGIDTPYSAERIYWLVQNTRPGARILSIPTAASGSSVPESYSFTTVHEDRTTYFATLLNGEDNDNFFGAAVTSEPVDQELTVTNSDATSGIPISVDVVLQGGTDLQNHRVSVQFNGASIGEVDFYALANVTNTFPVDPSLLHDGTNTVTLTALEGDNDVSLVQSIVLHYPHRYIADANWLRATAPAGSSLHISGFTSPQIRIFDITNPQSIAELGGSVALESSAYGVTLSTSNPGPAERILLAFSDDQISAPDALTHHLPSSLAQYPRAADVVMITHPDFAADLLPLAKLHESEGHSVTVVTVDAIFDAFNFGERSPYAIRNYLQSVATASSRKPQAVLLVGDASLDPRNYLGFGSFDFVPTRIVETQALKTASDDWFTDFQQTGFATIPTGRLPVRTTADAELVVSKIVEYEKGAGAGPWNQQALVISDQNAGENFTLESQYAITNLPPSLKPAQIVADGMDPITAHQQILAGLNNGALLVNYTGHGATEQWSFSDLFDNNDAAALTNGQRLPLFLMMDCLNGFFHDVYSQSLAESLLLAPNGGAVAVWASSGFTTSPPQASMNQAMLHALQLSPSMTIGAAALQSKLSVTDKDVRRTWILFGDPAMKLQFTTQPNGRQSPAQPSPPFRSGAGSTGSCPRCPVKSKSPE